MSRHDTQTIDIAAAAEEVRAFVADGENLPRWAIGFAKSVERSDAGWSVSTGSGDLIGVQVKSDAGAGTVDFVMSPGPGVTMTAWTRVMPTPDGALFSFTQIQPSAMPDDVFDGQVQALGHELVALKALLEVQCPI